MILTQEIVKQRIKKIKPNIILLSSKVNSTSKLEFYCKICNQKCLGIISNLLKSVNCCLAKNFPPANKYSIETISKDLKKSKPYLCCLENDYKDCFFPMMWYCVKCDLIFENSWASVKKSKEGCASCAGTKKHSLQSIKDFLNNNHLKIEPLFKDKDYKKAGLKYPWKCGECDYRWSATWNNINTFKSGCPSCSKTNPWTVERIKHYIKENRLKIELIDSNFSSGVKIKRKWKCLNCNNIFNKDWDHILRENSTCQCSSFNKGERMVQEILEKYFNEKFIKFYPPWLKNPKTGFQLEIDLYSKKLNMAIEVHGIQHYEEIDFFYSKKPKTAFKDRKQIDRIKKKLIKKQGLIFIEINTTNVYNNSESLKKAIVKAFKKSRINLNLK